MKRDRDLQSAVASADKRVTFRLRICQEIVTLTGLNFKRILNYQATKEMERTRFGVSCCIMFL